MSWAVAGASSAACCILSLNISSGLILAVEMLPSITATVSFSGTGNELRCVLLGKEMQTGRHGHKGVLNKTPCLPQYSEWPVFMSALRVCLSSLPGYRRSPLCLFL